MRFSFASYGDWAAPHLQAGRIPPVTPEVYIALVSGAPQWIARMVRIGMANSPLESLRDELARFVRGDLK
jgi:hypothetical protein